MCLFAAHQLALNAVAAAGRDKSQWRSFSAAIFFLAVCLAYFPACRRLSLAIEWIFLLGFLPSWPIAVPAAYRLRTAGHLLRDFLWAALGFSAFFWAAGGLMLWRTAAL